MQFIAILKSFKFIYIKYKFFYKNLLVVNKLKL